MNFKRVIVLGLVCGALLARSHGGVTIITHGLNGNVDGWITGMANRIPAYPGFLGTNFSCYQTTFTPNGGGFLLSATRVAGAPANVPESGEIVIKLDWRNLADGNSYNTHQVASAIVPALFSTNFIPELGGRAVVDFPLHMIGHSRGASLICELSRRLGTNGIWVDHLSSLDAHPLNDPDFPLDALAFSAIDAPVNSYANVLFHDSYWQNIDFLVRGKAVPGSYIRRLVNLSGGNSSSHSDVHLWYHGTIDFRVPANDFEANITAAERTNWWSAFESRGTNTGYLYSLIGGGDRASTARPNGLAMVREGLNQLWDFGAGTSANRTSLPSNSGEWPNLVKFNRTTTNQIEQGQSVPVKFFYQWAKAATNVGTITFYLDTDLNPLNANQTTLQQLVVPATGSSVSSATANIALSNAPAGSHYLLATISGGGKTRYLYAPESVEVMAVQQPPVMDISLVSLDQHRVSVFGRAGDSVVIFSSTNLQDWAPLATNTLISDRWDYTNSSSAAQQFYRAILP